MRSVLAWFVVLGFVASCGTGKDRVDDAAAPAEKIYRIEWAEGHCRRLL